MGRGDSKSRAMLYGKRNGRQDAGPRQARDLITDASSLFIGKPVEGWQGERDETIATSIFYSHPEQGFLRCHIMARGTEGEGATAIVAVCEELPRNTSPDQSSRRFVYEGDDVAEACKAANAELDRVMDEGWTRSWDRSCVERFGRENLRLSLEARKPEMMVRRLSENYDPTTRQTEPAFGEEVVSAD